MFGKLLTKQLPNMNAWYKQYCLLIFLFAEGQPSEKISHAEEEEKDAIETEMDQLNNRNPGNFFLQLIRPLLKWL